ncbi:MAG: 4-(cytidine 5'-diphospho)-2-C-methyl-D-erythritol kinase [Oscillospiraceae bacterium]|nr:4-(cytidine 5'-diphospho)-2-C-methyl-D-erythritol kinase [Oscillospiraceae bacterium]
MTETALAYAKVNLSLDIVSKMPDGYHSMQMVMQSVSLADEITLTCEKGEGIRVKSELSFLPGDARNIAAKAALAFFNYTAITGYRTHIELVKKIPVCAGLGGGSSDGACVLRILDKMFKTALTRAELEKIGMEVGSDVPFCIDGGTSLAEGRGEILTNLTPLPECFILICKPPFSCSTPALFKRINVDKIKARPDTPGLIKALSRSDLTGVARRMYNVFEDVLPRGGREIDEIKGVMQDKNAIGTVMTGSGPSVIGLFENGDAAQEAYIQLRKSYKECFLSRTVERLGYK